MKRDKERKKFFENSMKLFFKTGLMTMKTRDLPAWLEGEEEIQALQCASVFPSATISLDLSLSKRGFRIVPYAFAKYRFLLPQETKIIVAISDPLDLYVLKRCAVL